MQTTRSAGRAIRFLVQFVWANHRRAFLLSTIELLFAIAKGAIPALLGLLVSGAASGRQQLVWLAAGGLVFAAGGSLLATVVGTKYRLRTTTKLSVDFDAAAARLIPELPPQLSNHPEHSTKIDAFATSKGAVGMAFNRVMNSVRHCLTPIVIATAAVLTDARLSIMVLLGALYLYAVKLTETLERRAEEASFTDLQNHQMLLDDLVTVDSAIEIRANRAQGFFNSLLLDTLTRATRSSRAAKLRSELFMIGFTLLYFLAAGAVLYWIGVSVAGEGKASFVLTLAITSTVSLQTSLWQVYSSLRVLWATLRGVERYLWLQNATAEIGDFDTRAHRAPRRHVDPSAIQTTDIQLSGRHPSDDLRSDDQHRDIQNNDSQNSDVHPHVNRNRGIKLANASFTYPGMARPALDDCTVNIPPGQIVSLVGRNGSGKSTLANILIGALAPSSGSCELPAIDHENASAMVFQDFMCLETSLRSTVRAGDEQRSDADIVSALDAAGARWALEYEDALNVNLGGLWHDGIVPSTGQWQTLAVARATLRENPLLLIYDEHTSALDPIAEADLLARYLEHAATVAEAGGIVIFITHRLAICRRTDRILVLDQGQLVEDGSHSELMKSAGLYYELFEAQASGYR